MGFGGDLDGTGAFGLRQFGGRGGCGGEQNEGNGSQGWMGFDPREQIYSRVVIDLVAGEDGGGEAKFGAVMVDAGAGQVGLGLGDVPRDGYCAAVRNIGEGLGEDVRLGGVVLDEQEVVREVVDHALNLRVSALGNHMEFSLNGRV